MISYKIICRKVKPKSKELINETIQLMEKVVDERLSNLKAFIPILLAVITSVIAFLMVYEVDKSTSEGKMIFYVASILLLSFAVLIGVLFGKSTYKATILKAKKAFNPALLHTYCYLSDEAFIKCLEKYAGRKLSEIEILKTSCLKQKINEYTRKNATVDTVYVLVVVGAITMAVSCVICTFK